MAVAKQQRPVRLLLWISVLHAVALLLFARGFLLTRVELPNTSPCGEQCQGRQQYDKAVVLIIDALRHDFVCMDAGIVDRQPHQGLFNQTLELLAAAGDAATTLKFVADTPTITMSRLKALLTGGLPTFLDIGTSFSASTVTEDNLVAQLIAQKKRLVFMGDDTWMQLVPGAFVESHPYPSFNVKDLHTVDDGVWQHLLPALERPGDWDVLIGHYLGVDHAGHTHGVASPQMRDKVVQMDGQVAHVLRKLAAQAGPGGPYARAVLLVMGDHGQTMGGDHGGGSPDETDSVLIAVSLAKLHAALHGQQPGETSSQHSCQAPVQQQQQQQQQHDSSASALVQQLLAGGQCSSDATAAAATPAPGHLSASASAELMCARSIPQVDLTPTLAVLLGLAVPYGNIGKVAPELWAVLGSSKDANGWLASYHDALWDNAQQVHTYLNAYADVASLPAKDLAHCNALFDTAAAAVVAAATGAAANAGAAATTATQMSGPAASEMQMLLLEGVRAHLTFLEAAAALARAQFTQFHQPLIWAGCLAAAAALAYQLLLCRRALREAGGSWTPESRALAVLASLHALCLFSVRALMGEGRLQGCIIAVLTLLLVRAALSAALAARTAARRQLVKSAGAVGLTAEPQQEAAEQHSADWDARARIIPCGYLVRMRGKDTGAEDAKGDFASGTGRTAMLARSWAGPQAAFLAVALGAVLLGCTGALQAWGLIDRAGQDPHDKMQMNQELLGAAAGSGQWARQLAVIQAPLAAIVLLLWVADKRLAQLGSRCSGSIGKPWQLADDSRAGGNNNLRLDLLRHLTVGAVVVEFGCISAWWLAHRCGVAESSLLTFAAAQGSDGTVGPFGTLCMLLAAVAPGDTFREVLGPMLGLQLRLLLPRLVYLLALLVLCSHVLVGVMAVISGSRRPKGDSGRAVHSAHSWLGEQQQQLIQVARAFLWLAGSFAGPLVLVLGFRGPWVMLLALLQAMALLWLLALHAKASQALQQLEPQYGESTAETSGLLQNGRAGAAADAAAHGLEGRNHAVQCGSMFSNGVAPGLWAMHVLHLFFCSGHFCEFTGLQYSSSFIGFDDVVWAASGSLLLLNTFGFLMLGCLSFPIFVAVGMLLNDKQLDSPAQPGGLPKCFAGALSGALLVGNSMRFAALGVCIVSASIQQRHILLWAIFAPKLVFEVLFVAVTDVFQLLTSWLACAFVFDQSDQ